MSPDTGRARRVTRLAIDLGAESGRLVEGRMDVSGRLSLEEKFRFLIWIMPFFSKTAVM